MNGPWELDPDVAIRRERFGGLAYHYGNRRLTLLRSPQFVDVVTNLAAHGSTDEALAATGVDRRQWPAFRAALASLADRGLVRPRA